MRRLWSYIILTGASLVLMGSTFTNVFKRSTSNIEYSDGREMVFRLSNKDETELEEKNVDGKSPAEVITASMMKRLASSFEQNAKGSARTEISSENFLANRMIPIMNPTLDRPNVLFILEKTLEDRSMRS